MATIVATGKVTEIQHRVTIHLDTPHPYTDLLGRTRDVCTLRIEYGLSAIAHRTDVTVHYKDTAALIPPVADIPDWIQALIDQHKPAGPACTLH
ncbi:MAG: hypothetical protein HOY79_04270 [Streptomyces sp.]|nr:hypothetical protein [Streptomyces sp.]NUS15421.1 hypothetical protein [Streptomyces sp.]NUS24121.1 hypothetical protein [Streptomyces sp.]